MGLGKVALGDREKAREPGFGSQEVVVGRIEPTRSIRVRKAIADGEDPALGIVEESEAHRVGERRRPLREAFEPPTRFHFRTRPDQLPQPFGHRHEGARQIAAIHRRDVARIERSEASRVVPVEEMSFEPLQSLHRGEASLEPLDELDPGNQAEVVGGERRQEAHTDVRGRRAVSQPGLGYFLEIVRR